MKFFNAIKTIEELRKLYKKLVMENHPDKHPEAVEHFTAIMAQINSEYDNVFALLKRKGRTGNRPADEANTTDLADNYKEILNKLINLDGIIIELIGSWLWVSGNTFHCKQELKSAGLLWASKKRMWYWRPDEEACRKSRGLDIDEIRSKYGSQNIVGTPRKRLSA